MAALIRASIRQHLRQIKDEEVENLMNRLKEIGVRDLETARFEGAITEEDLKGVIPVVLARILLRKWTAAEPNKEVPVQQLPVKSRHLEPQLDFADPGLQRLLAIITAMKTTGIKEKRQILNAACEQIYQKHGLETNLHIDSWVFVAKQLANKYPTLFENVAHAATAMSSHISYLIGKEKWDSEPKRKRTKAETEANAYGCKLVDYKDLPPVEHTQIIVEELQEEHKLGAANWNAPRVAQLMAEIFKTIHRDLNESKLSVSKAKKKYPFLFEPQFMLQYFEELTGIAANDAFNRFMEKHLMYAFMHFFRPLSRPRNELIAMIAIDKMRLIAEKAADGDTNKQPLLLAVLLFAQMQFHGGADFDAGSFILTARKSMTDEQIKQELNLPDTPIIVALGVNYMIAKRFVVCIEGLPVMRVDGICQALSCCFASFYVFSHLCYPQNTCFLWEFIQRAVFNLNPEEDGDHLNARGKSKKGPGKLSISQRVAAAIASIMDLRNLYEE